MAAPEARPETTLRLERTIRVPRDKVFAAWTTAETLARWFGPTEAYTIVVHALDARPGGEYRFEMVHAGGNRHQVHGVYREVVSPSRISFTWTWDDKPELGETLVTVEFAAEGVHTRLLLTHELFPSTEVRDNHNMGWTGGLDHLVALLEA